MVDNSLISLYKERFDKGIESVESADINKIFTLFQQISEEDEEMQEELEDLDISAQILITDVTKYFYLIAKDGKLKTGEGKIDNPSFTFSTTLEIGFGLLTGDIDGTSAYMAGDFKVEGNLASALEFLEVIEIGLEIIEELIEE